MAGAMARAALLAVLAAAALDARAAVRIGCFVHPASNEIELAKAAGFDFVELGLRDVVALPARELDALIARTRQIPIEAMINFLPAELKVVGPKVDVAAQEAYLARAFAVAERLGVKTVVFGSGKARSFPAGFEREHEPPAAVLAARDRLQHVRIANPAGRAFPLAANEADYGGFFAALRKIDYRGAIGIEARAGSLAGDGPRSVAFLREMAGKLVPNAERP
jgi:sugar phosphate isomerase/epimerase